MSGAPGAQHYLAAAEFVLMLRQSGLADKRVLRAMEQVPRVPFVDQRWFSLADEDIALPIGCGQSVLAPSLTGAMIEALNVQPGQRVLHIGTGSGYAAAILARLAGQVISLERWRSLADEAHVRLRGLGYDMIDVVFADGTAGYPLRAPYDRILATCALREIPAGLAAQLKPEGVIVAPLLRAGEAAAVTRLARENGALAGRIVCKAAVPPAVEGVARRL